MTHTLDGLVRPGVRVALGDGVGAPRPLTRDLVRAAGRHGDVRLLLGWVPVADPQLDPAAFADVRTVMPGWGLRPMLAAGAGHAIPTRLSAVPSLVRGPLRPDVLLATVVRSGRGYTFTSEVSWMRSAVEAGATVAAWVSTTAPRCDAGPPLPRDQVAVVGSGELSPLVLPAAEPTADHERIGRLVDRLVPEGARLQIGPGPLGTAVLRALSKRVRIDSGLLPESVVDAAERGLVLGEAVATYLAGGPRLYSWADGRQLLRPIEFTHDPSRLSANPPLIAVNTAVEIDLHGQVNVEGSDGAMVGGIGGHPDYAAAATRSIRGLSIIAVPTRHRGRSTLVARLSCPVSTPAHDVDVVVTERGSIDLRGLDRPERTAALRELWGPDGRRTNSKHEVPVGAPLRGK